MEIMNYSRTAEGRRSWIVEESRFVPDHLAKCESIFCLGNGYLGQRAALEESYAGEKRDLFVNGTFNRSEADEAPELPNLPDMTNLEITVNGERFTLERGRILAYSRRLDLYTGELCREVEWESPSGGTYSLRFLRFASQENSHTIGMRVEITPKSADARITLRTGINGQWTNSGAQHFLKGGVRLYPGNILEMSVPTTQSGVWCCLHAACLYSLGGKRIEPAVLPIMERRAIYAKTSLDCPAGETLVLEKLCCVHTSRDVEYADLSGAVELDVLKETGHALAQGLEACGYAGLFRKSAEAWAAWWAEHDVRIDTDNGFHQLALRFALYHLNIMTSKQDPRVGIAAKGLTGEGYLGHSFWDTEIFILPFFTFTSPSIARQLLQYRWYCLYGAREKARENGYEGAMYPWETAWITDGEATPLWGGADVVTGKPMPVLTGLIEHHITADVSYAVWQYYQATGDREFMRQYGYEMILDTARFWASRAKWDESRGAFVINDVIGPDEYKEHVDNNAYTNYMAHWNMKLALHLIDTLPSEEPETASRLDRQFDLAASRDKIQKTADGLYLPQPDKDGILPQFDNYFNLEPIDLEPYKRCKQVGTIYHDYNMEQISRMQVSKQADVLMLFFLLDGLFDSGIKRKNYEFYEARTLHDSSLSKNTHCVLACDLEFTQQAEDFFEGSCSIDLGQTMDSSDMGIHAAAMGGIWMSAVYGFGGVRLTGGELAITPRLHPEWRSLSFPLCWQGSRLEVSVKPESVSIVNKGDKPVEIRVCGDKTAIEGGARYERQL